MSSLHRTCDLSWVNGPSPPAVTYVSPSHSPLPGLLPALDEPLGLRLFSFEGRIRVSRCALGSAGPDPALGVRTWRSEAGSPSDAGQGSSTLSISAALPMKSQEKLDSLRRTSTAWFCLAWNFAISDSLLCFPLVPTSFLDLKKCYCFSFRL